MAVLLLVYLKHFSCASSRTSAEDQDSCVENEWISAIRRRSEFSRAGVKSAIAYSLETIKQIFTTSKKNCEAYPCSSKGWHFHSVAFGFVPLGRFSIP
jgi:hypothetical protein